MPLLDRVMCKVCRGALLLNSAPHVYTKLAQRTGRYFLRIRRIYAITRCAQCLFQNLIYLNEAVFPHSLRTTTKKKKTYKTSGALCVRANLYCSYRVYMIPKQSTSRNIKRLT